MQRIVVKVTPHAKANEVVDDFIDILGVRNIKLKVSAPPENGKANEAVINLLATYLKVSKTNITITSGLKSSVKLVSINKHFI